MSIWFYVCCFLLCVLVPSLVVLTRFSKRLLQFDDLFGLLIHDVDINISYFDKLLETPTFSNEPEIVDANKNMKIMRARFDEYLSRLRDVTQRSSETREKRAVSVSSKPPKVV